MLFIPLKFSNDFIKLSIEQLKTCLNLIYSLYLFTHIIKFLSSIYYDRWNKMPYKNLNIHSMHIYIFLKNHCKANVTRASKLTETRTDLLDATFQERHNNLSTASRCPSLSVLFCWKHIFYHHSAYSCQTVSKLRRKFWWICQRLMKTYYCYIICASIHETRKTSKIGSIGYFQWQVVFR